MFKKVRNIHFVGIGGIGMSGIAELLHNLGYRVSGSDLSESKITKRLQEMGIRISLGHRAENVGDAEVVVFSSAVPPTNPELEEAESRKIPAIPRAEMLNELMRLKTGIAISGTHGKTSTTSMVAEIFAAADLDPTYVIGGKLNSIDSNARLGKGEYLIFEACEAFGSFLYFSPIILTVLNIDEDHLEYYETMDALRGAFLQFINKIPFYGVAILNNDDANIQDLMSRVKKRVLTFGIDTESDYMAEAIEFDGWRSSFDFIRKGKKLGRISLNVPGRHNVSNALAAAAIATELEIPLEVINKALSCFVNADRRFQIKGSAAGVTVVDDYAHHPAEVAATLKAAQGNKEGRVIAVFQPHLFSRTLALYKDFATALETADEVVLAPIYPAREKPLPGVSSQLIQDRLVKNGYPAATLVDDQKKLCKVLKEKVRPGDFVLFMGAGSIWRTAEEFLEVLKREEPRYGE